MENRAYPRPRGFLFVGLIVFSMLGGVLGSALILNAAQSNDTVRRFLGFLTDSKGQPVVTTRQEKLILEESSAITETVTKVSPAVVSILSTRNVRDFFGNITEQTGGGTGFVIDKDGFILTNQHVVSDKNAAYTVITSDGKNYEAKVLALDPVFDLAVIKVEASLPAVVDLGDSNDTQIGQWVVAIGNALGEFQNTVTVGVISAKDRQITAGGATGAERLEGLIQTDAAINPGNSGGPLVNLKGQVIGINTAKAEAQGIGFAIPINIAKTAIDSVKKTGRVVRPMLGIRYLPITKEIARLENLSVDSGALIARSAGGAAIIAGGPADKAGLQEGDIITAVNNEEITELRSLARLLQQYQVGDQITLKYIRKGETKEVKVALEELK